MYEDLVKRLRSHNGWALNKTLDEAADAIEKLEKFYQIMADAYETEVTKERWIPVTERLPQDEETVLTWGNQETILLDWRHDNKWCCFGEVTHWMPLPEPPKEEA